MHRQARQVMIISVLILAVAGLAHDINNESQNEIASRPITIRLSNQSRRKVTAVMKRTMPSGTIPLGEQQSEQYRVKPYGEAKFITGRANECLSFTLLNDGSRYAEKTFGPFHDTSECRVTWNGAILGLAKRNQQSG